MFRSNEAVERRLINIIECAHVSVGYLTIKFDTNYKYKAVNVEDR